MDNTLKQLDQNLKNTEIQKQLILMEIELHVLDSASESGNEKIIFPYDRIVDFYRNVEAIIKSIKNIVQ